MSRENVEIVRRVYGQWSQGEFWDLGTLLAPHATLRSELPPGEILAQGPRSIGGFFLEFLRQRGYSRIEGDEFIDLGEDAVLVVRHADEAARGGAQTEQPLSIVWKLQAGVVTSMYAAIDRDRALEAAGLRE